jgi:membrane protease YdiL (CAAX protease family)
VRADGPDTLPAVVDVRLESAPPRLPKLRWGIGDVCLAFIIGSLVAIFVTLPLLGRSHRLDFDCRATVDQAVPIDAPGSLDCGPGETPTIRSVDTLTPEVTFGLALPAQNLPIVGVLWWASRRKGQRSLARDFGWRLRRRDWWWLLVGVGVTIGLGILLAPVNNLLPKNPEPQDVARDLANVTRPTAIAAAILAVVVLAPAVEELLFRGALLRSLQRKTSDGWAIAIQGTVFGLIHATGTSFDLSAIPTLAALTILGVLLGVIATRSGSLSRTMLIHAGFNAVALLQLLG